MKNNGCTRTNTSEGNVQSYLICIIHNEFWIKIQNDEEHETVGIEGPE